MSKHKGKPSGKYKPDGTGVPSNLNPDTIRSNEQQTDKYTVDDIRMTEQVRLDKPNRNTRKTKATNAHGYKN